MSGSVCIVDACIGGSGALLWTVFGRTPHLQHLLIAERAAPAFIRSREVLERLLLEKLVVAEHGAELARLVHSEGREIGALVARRCGTGMYPVLG